LFLTPPVELLLEGSKVFHMERRFHTFFGAGRPPLGVECFPRFFLRDQSRETEIGSMWVFGVPGFVRV